MALKIDDTTIVSKKTTSKSNITRVHFILDESGSMNNSRQSTIDGFNEYINGLRGDTAGNTYKISLTKFEGGHVRRVFTDVSLQNMRDITLNDYTPSGMTNLNDAIGTTLLDMEKNPLYPNKLYNTLIVIMTDGYENASREWSQQATSDMIKNQEQNGWTVTFLGANIDTQSVSAAYSIDSGNARSYTTKGMKATMSKISEATVMYASTASVGSSMRGMLSSESLGYTDKDWMDEDDA